MTGRDQVEDRHTGGVNHGHQAERLPSLEDGTGDYFTGTVRIEPVIDTPAPARVTVT